MLYNSIKYDSISPWELKVNIKVKVQFYSLISSLKTYHPTLHLILPPGHWTHLFVCHFNSTERIQSCSRSAHWTYRTLCHLCPTRYSFSHKSTEAFVGEVPCQRTQHLNNVPRLREEEHDNSLKILHQAGFETARQAATSAEHHALTIAPCPSLTIILQLWHWSY